MWLRLSKEKATKKSESHAARVRDAAQCYEVHADFHADIRGYIDRLYAIAAGTLERFQTLKTQRGLIDFTDMEQLTLRALDNAVVVERLDDELELLLVDEFQDTNPMQLALFMKLARIATRVIFVGDVKQAIYAFRGCDPELVSARAHESARRRRADRLSDVVVAHAAAAARLSQCDIRSRVCGGRNRGRRGRVARAAN